MHIFFCLKSKKNEKGKGTFYNGLQKFAGSGALCIAKLFDDNFHIWKQKIEVIFPYREIDVAVFDGVQFPRGSSEFAK